MPTSRFSKRCPLVGLFLAVTVFSSPVLATRSNVDRVVTFGASLSDTGNGFFWLSQPENQQCGTPLNVPPFDKLDDLVTPGGPYARGGLHVSNGAVWVEGFARYLALSGNERPVFRSEAPKASNYAVAGARAVADYPCRVNLPTQVAAYLTDFAETSERTVVTIEIGGNDVRDALIAAVLLGQDPGPYIHNALSSLAASMVQLYAHGARRFLILNVPDVGKTPAVRMLDQAFPGIAPFAGIVSASYNAALADVLDGLDTLPAIDIRILDVYTMLNAVVANPAAYGFSNATEACVTPNEPSFTCATPDTYAFWDGIHPTKALHALVAQQAIEAIED